MLQFKLNNLTHLKGQSKLLLWSFCIALFATSCTENAVEEIEKLSKDRSKIPVSISKNMALSLSDSAIKKIQINAPVLERYDNANPAFNKMPKGIHITFLDSLGKSEATVDANYAIHHPDAQILELENNVVIVNKKGDKLNSEHVTWNSQTHKISSNDFVKITTEDQIIYGDGFIANEDFTDYQINHIKGIVAIDAEDPVPSDSISAATTPLSNEDVQ